jgi:SAM-dependent methyltransferase
MATHAERARSFGAVADAYDRGRPGYPLEAVRWLLGTAPLDVVDLGAGTGKLTETLVAAGHRVVAVEPSAEMSAHLRQRLPGVRVVAASAEETGLPKGSCDAVVAGAAFHWFDRVRAFGEIGRILRRPGVLGLLGNGFDRTMPWIENFAQVAGSQGQGHARNWPDAAELGQYFSEVEDADFGHVRTISRPQLLDLALSRSHVATLDPDERAALLARVDGLWDSEPELKGRERVEMANVTRIRRATGLR